MYKVSQGYLVSPGIRVPLAIKGLQGHKDLLVKTVPKAQQDFRVLQEARVLMVIKARRVMPARAPQGPLALKVPQAKKDLQEVEDLQVKWVPKVLLGNLGTKV